MSYRDSGLKCRGSAGRLEEQAQAGFRLGVATSFSAHGPKPGMWDRRKGTPCLQTWVRSITSSATTQVTPQASHCSSLTLSFSFHKTRGLDRMISMAFKFREEEGGEEGCLAFIYFQESSQNPSLVRAH